MVKRQRKAVSHVELGRQTLRVIEDDAAYAIVWINDIEVYMVVDSASELTVIDKEIAEKLGVVVRKGWS